MRGKAPLVAEWILDAADAIAVGHIGWLVDGCGAGSQGAAVRGVRVRNVEIIHAGHRLIRALSFAKFELAIAYFHRHVMNDPLGIGMLSQIKSAESLLQKTYHGFGAAWMHVGLHGGRAQRFIRFSASRGDVPKITRRIFHARGPFPVRHIGWFVEGCGTGSESAAIGGICVSDVYMERHGTGFAFPGNIWAAAPDHHHGVADAELAMDSSSRTDIPEGFLRAESRFQKINRASRILEDEIRREGRESFPYKIHFWFDRGGAHR